MCKAIIRVCYVEPYTQMQVTGMTLGTGNIEPCTRCR